MEPALQTSRQLSWNWADASAFASHPALAPGCLPLLRQARWQRELFRPRAGTQRRRTVAIAHEVSFEHRRYTVKDR